MASPTGSKGTFDRWYSNRIAEPTTGDEAKGYWLFALGVILGIIGIVAFLTSVPAGTIRLWSIVVASAGLALVVAGPIIRLPLRRSATLLVYLGLLLCAAGIVWFITAFPAQWNPSSGQASIIGVYAVGLLAMALGGVFVPILSGGPIHEEELATTRDERDEAREAQADTEADEADLAAQLRSLRQSKAQFELYQSTDDQWRWRLRHRNGNIVADSGESYTQRVNAQKGMQSVRRNALGATTLLIEREADLPEAGTTDGFMFPAAVESKGTFERYEDDAGEHRWRLRHDNGNIVADSGEGYVSRNGADRAIERVRELVGPADYLRIDPTAFEFYRDQAGEWRWRLIHRNGNILADSAEGYAAHSGARKAVERLRERVTDLEFEVYDDRAGEYRWRLRGRNNQIIADSGEGYDDENGAAEAVDRITEYAPAANALDIGRAAFEIFEDRSGTFRWRLRARNGNILADSGEGYDDRSGVIDAIEGVKRNAPGADTED